MQYGWLIAIPVLFMLLLLVIASLVLIYEFLFPDREENDYEQ
jgi:hypothetical protein